MTIYFVLIVSAIILYFMIGDNDTERTRKIYVSILTIVLITIAGLRHMAVGNDTLAYLNRFESMNKTDWGPIIDNIVIGFLHPKDAPLGKDPGMWVLNKLLSYVISNQQIYLSVLASFVLVPLGMFFLKTCDTLKQLLFAYSWYITLYFSYLPCSAIRQGIALGLLLLAYLALMDKKTIWVVIYVLIAALFHKSSLIVSLFFIFYMFKRPFFIYRCSFFIFLLVLLFYDYIGLYLADTEEIYSHYNGHYYASGHDKPYVVIVFYIGLYIMSLFVMNKLKTEDFNIKTELSLIGCALTIIFVPLVRLDPSLIRITGYFVAWSFVLVPQCISKYPRNLRQLLFLVCILIFIYRTLSSGDYAFYWQDMQLHERYR